VIAQGVANWAAPNIPASNSENEKEEEEEEEDEEEEEEEEDEEEEGGGGIGGEEGEGDMGYRGAARGRRVVEERSDTTAYFNFIKTHTVG
jgi:hypothetical protein